MLSRRTYRRVMWTAGISASAAVLFMGGEPARAALRVAQAARAAQLTREQAVALVQNRFDARVVRVDVLNQDGRRIYSMRLLSRDSKVWTVRVDASSGEIR